MSTRLAEALDACEAARAAGAKPGRDRPPDLFGGVAEVPATPAGNVRGPDLAVERVHSHTSNDWKDAAIEAVRAAALAHDALTVEDVDWPEDLEPYDDRARGGVMRAAARAGWIESTKTYRPSVRPETHRRPLLVWSSRLRDAA